MRKLIFKEKIYSYNIDFVGHVNNIEYIRWLEHGRNLLLEAIGLPIGELDQQTGIVPVLIETQITYKKPLFITDEVAIEMWISQLNNASAIMNFEILNANGDCCASAWQKGLFIDRKTMRPKRLDEKHRAAFMEYVID